MESILGSSLAGAESCVGHSLSCVLVYSLCTYNITFFITCSWGLHTFQWLGDVLDILTFFLHTTHPQTLPSFPQCKALHSFRNSNICQWKGSCHGYIHLLYTWLTYVRHCHTLSVCKKLPNPCCTHEMSYGWSISTYTIPRLKLPCARKHKGITNL